MSLALRKWLRLHFLWQVVLTQTIIKCKNNDLTCYETTFDADECAYIELKPDPQCICSNPDTCDRIDRFLSTCNRFTCNTSMSTLSSSSPSTTNTVTTAETTTAPSCVDKINIFNILSFVLTCLISIVGFFLKFGEICRTLSACMPICYNGICYLARKLYSPFRYFFRFLYRVIEPCGIWVERRVNNWLDRRNQSNDEREPNGERSPIIR